MKRIRKKLITFLLMLIMAISAVVPANAASSGSYNTSSSYKSYATCTLKNAKTCGYVGVQTWNSYRYGRTQRNTVKMTTTKGRYIWEEKGAISCSGYRKFYLGNDHKAYRIYVKTYYGAGGASFTNRGNVDIKINK